MSKEQLFQDRFRQLLGKLGCIPWLDNGTKLGANPIFIGYDLNKYFKGDHSPIYLALGSMEWTGDLRYNLKLLDFLPSTRAFNKELAEYSLEGITLNLWEPYNQFDHTQVEDFKKLFYQDRFSG
ncbi:hypothetical protein V8F33_013796 [Rhypophila sp. PSN 637]